MAHAAKRICYLSPGRPRPPSSSSGSSGSGSSTLPCEGAKPRGSLRSRLVAACYPGRSSQSMRSSPRGSFARLRLAQLANSRKRAANEILPGLPSLAGLWGVFFLQIKQGVATKMHFPRSPVGLKRRIYEEAPLLQSQTALGVFWVWFHN